MRVIVDRVEGDFYIARSQYDSPEVDEEILIPTTTPLEIGSMVDIRVTDYDEYDLYGELKMEN